MKPKRKPSSASSSDLSDYEPPKRKKLKEDQKDNYQTSSK